MGNFAFYQPWPQASGNGYGQNEGHFLVEKTCEIQIVCAKFATQNVLCFTILK